MAPQTEDQARQRLSQRGAVELGTGACHTTTGRELVNVPGGELIDVQIARTVERDSGGSLAAEIDAGSAAGSEALDREAGRIRCDDESRRSHRKGAGAGVARIDAEIYYCSG